MLQFAGLAAILNEINPGLGDKLAVRFNGTITDKVNETLLKPIAKSYKYGIVTGLIVGVLGGTLFTVVVYKIRQQRQNSLKVD